MARSSSKLSELSLLCRSLTSQQGSQRRKKSRLSTGGNDDQKKSRSLLSAFHMYSPFSSKENVESREVLPCDPASPQAVDMQQQLVASKPSAREPPPLYVDLNPINAILEEEGEGAGPPIHQKAMSTVTGTGTGITAKKDKSGSDSDGGGGNRLKRNIKHTGSLIVRKFRASRHGGVGGGGAKGGGGDAGKKDARSNTNTNESAGPSGNAMDNDNEKPNTTQNTTITTTPMLRTTTL
ncbi:uncharacterized protein [Drosophila tropicalis]|uniref:uncharacterized protein n=1 Tax=Drosophila tropicalis TaxID=46794 RepID=UPI0035AB6D07